MKTAPVASRQDDPYILLVDDNRDGLLARRLVLEETGYRVRTATNGEEALELMLADKFDVVVTDYKMPRMNGVELIQHIRKRRPETAIVLVSGFVEPLGLNEQTTGADAVVAKSAQEVNHLLRSVSRLLNRRKNSRAVPRKPPASQAAALKAKHRAR